MIDKSLWLKAQEEEEKFHHVRLDKGIQIYWNTYYHLFQYVGVKYSQLGVSILEIGPAEFPALYYVRDYAKSYVIEPLHSLYLPHLIASMNAELIIRPAEETIFPDVDEVWLFNVLTHTMDPDLIIEKAKGHSQCIRYFEPINQETNSSHFWNFPRSYFEDHFPGSVNYYPANQGIPGFHEHECVYGVYHV